MAAAQLLVQLHVHQSLCLQRTEPPSLLLPSLLVCALALTYAFRSWVYAMLLHVIIECVRAAAVYGGLYIVGMCLYQSAKAEKQEARDREHR